MKIDPFEMHYVHCPPPTPRYIIQIRAAGLTKWATIYSANAQAYVQLHLATIFKCALVTNEANVLSFILTKETRQPKHKYQFASSL